MRKILLITMTATLVLIGYVVYQLIEQNTIDQNFSNSCVENPQYNTALVFAISKENTDPNTAILLNNEKTKFDTMGSVDETENIAR